jgi:hypothetical protein
MMSYDECYKQVEREKAFAQFMCWPFLAAWAIGFVVHYWS